tara:strand:- start:345 stop:581 length:237 start_codon:yes stop_codon:yes gene_type:complete
MNIKTETITTNIYKVGLYLTIEELSIIIESLYETNRVGDKELYTELNNIMKDGIEYIKNMDTPKKITEAEVINNAENC